MRVFDYHPQKREVDGNMIDPVFEGVIKVKVPKYCDRLKLMKDANFKISSTGEIDPTVDLLEQAMKMVEIAQSHTESVKLKRVDDGFEIKSFEDLEYDKDGSDLINEIANFVIGGGRLGKPLNAK